MDDFVTPHFSRPELACQCGCGRMEMDPVFMDKLEALRIEYGQPMVVSSGFRCPMYNDEASTTGQSGPHVTGMAVDVAVFGKNAHRLLTLALQHGFTGVGVSQKGGQGSRFLHLDAIAPGPGRPRPFVWSY